MAKVSKVVKSNGDVIIDISQDTVEPNNLLEGASAHGSDGEPVRGAVVMPTTVSITGAANGSGTFSNGAASVAVKRKACTVGNTTNSQTTNSPWYLAAQYTIPASNNNIYRADFLVESGFDSSLNTMGILEIVIRLNVVGTINTQKANWLVAANGIEPNDFALQYNGDTRICSLYAKRTATYSIFRFITLAESTNYNNTDSADVWTLFNTRTGITLPTGNNITTVYSSLDAVGYPLNKSLSDEDLNSLSVPGFYNASSSNTCANKPVSGSFGLLVIHSAIGNYWKQYFYPVSATAKPYFRSGNNGTWTAWTQETSQDITAMTGYSKPATTSAIATSDTLNAAIGKLEKENEILRNALSQSTFFIPEGTTTIDRNTITDRTKCFYYIPNGVASIDDSAFYKCTNLTNITIPYGVTSIGIAAFALCKSLESITMPNSVIWIYERAFAKCENFTSITIPDSVRTISQDVFYDCNNLTSITVDQPQGSISGAPWGAPNATVTWTG